MGPNTVEAFLLALARLTIALKTRPKSVWLYGFKEPHYTH
jgi:hypothetical protein